MLKLKDFVTQYGALIPTALLILLLAGCGSGGGSDNILCGGDPCPTVGDDTDDSTDDIDNIVDQGIPNSIEFIEASPTTISIQGAGGDETSIVTFLVTDTGGDPIEGVDVGFALDNTVGGISLSNTSDTTNVNGEASAVVRSGTASTSFRVVASVPSLSSGTSSNAITVSTGVADYDSFTLAVSKRAVQAWDFVGETVDVTARSSDVFNNPSPDGTQVSFYTEGGQIGASCILTAGGCSVTWTGQNPLAIEGIRQGRSEIMAVVTGAESFTDVNSNGVFDDGDIFDTSSGYDTQDDRPEPWLDINENDIYDSGEFYVDFNQSGSWDAPNGLYDGPLCEHTTMCSGEQSIAISRDNLIVMAASGPIVLANTVPGTINVSGGAASYSFIIGDVNGGTLPGGSTISIRATNGELASSVTSVIFSDFGTEAVTVSFTIGPDDTPSADGAFDVTVTTPAGTFVVISAAVID